ncbi:Hypothetical predicted protein [Lecanosticta acicola]|uniref:Uncharacterized protein n=1 Tax=Lecanosticta acicola TaxID=111012 RepID=A0AAI8Z905_9PEZI|nr:Hypothetical predicted protein [Lecanosticta acicola]
MTPKIPMHDIFNVRNFAPEINTNDLNMALRSASLVLHSPVALRCLRFMFSGKHTAVPSKDNLRISEIEGDPYIQEQVEEEEASIVKAKLEDLAKFVAFVTSNENNGNDKVKPTVNESGAVIAVDIPLPTDVLEGLRDIGEQGKNGALSGAMRATEMLLSYRLLHIIMHGLGHAAFYYRYSLEGNEPRVRQPLIGDEVASDWGCTLRQAVFGGILFSVDIGRQPYFVRAAAPQDLQQASRVNTDAGLEEDTEDVSEKDIEMEGDSEAGAGPEVVNSNSVVTLLQWPSFPHVVQRRLSGEPHKMALRCRIYHASAQAVRIPFFYIQAAFTSSTWSKEVPYPELVPTITDPHSVTVRARFGDDKTIDLRAYSNQVARPPEDALAIIDEASEMLENERMQSDFHPAELVRRHKLTRSNKPAISDAKMFENFQHQIDAKKRELGVDTVGPQGYNGSERKGYGHAMNWLHGGKSRGRLPQFPSNSNTM